MEKTLDKFVKDNSKFLKLADKEVFDGFYVSFRVAASTFDPEKETVVYKLKYQDGKEVYFQTASVAVARTFSKFKGGESVKIKRLGEGTKTSYKISSPQVVLSEDELEPDGDFNPDADEVV